MGIGKLKELIKSNSPSNILTVDITTFSGFNIAVDVDIIIYKFWAIEYEKALNRINPFTEDPDSDKICSTVMVKIASHLSNYFVSNKIRPIIVIGGVAPPEKDQFARVERTKVRQRAEERILQHANKYKYKTEAEYYTINPTILNDHIKLRKQTFPIPRDVPERLATYLEEKGYTVLHAKYEAEELCSALCLEDKVQAVYSTDTDNIVRRCPIMIESVKSTPNRIEAAIVVYDEQLLKNLGMTYSQFIDTCILLGCDYNKKLKGSGPDTIHNLILEHGNIRNLIKHFPDKNWDEINYKRCREIFNYKHIRTVEQCCLDPQKIAFL